MAMAYALCNADDHERQMSRHQLSLVDTCFEEGQYTSGISVLEQLRSPHLTPSESHVRQLLYIALYPPPPTAMDKGRENAGLPLEPSTPSKTVKQAQKSPLVPTVQAKESAIHLLTSFALTNRPSSLASALPKCVGISDWHERLRQIAEDEDEDSYIAREAMCIKGARHMWEILKEGAIQRKIPMPSSPRGKGKKRRRVVEFADEDTSFNNESPAVIGEHAWPVLDWLLLLVEKDEELMKERGFPPHSPILLSQIPPPRSNTGARWEADALLDVVFHCLGQSDSPKRKMMGARLWTALVNLASTIYIDLNLFVTSVYTRLSSLSTTPTDWFSLIFSLLPLSQATARFKVAFCRECLTSSASSKTSASGPRPALRPKPQARAMRAARRSDSTLDQESNTTTGANVTPTTSAISISVETKYPFPAPTEILKLMSAAVDSSHPFERSLRMKFELLASYSFTQAADPTQSEESDWGKMLRDGSVRLAIDSTFCGDAGSNYAVLLTSIIDSS